MSEHWDKFAEDLATQISQRVMTRVTAALEQHIRDGVKLVFTEQQAAEFFGVGIEKLQAWRKRKLISAARYPVGRIQADEKDRLGNEYWYDLASLMSFHYRYRIASDSPDAFAIKTDIQPLGAEIEARRLSLVG